MTEKYDENFVKQVAIGLDTATRLIESLAVETKDIAIDLASLETEIENITENVKSLSKILKDGNGSEPVIARLAVLETTTKNLENRISEIHLKVDDFKLKLVLLEQNEKQEEKDKEKREDLEIENSRQRSTNRLQILIAIATAIVSFLVAIFSAFYH